MRIANICSRWPKQTTFLNAFLQGLKGLNFISLYTCIAQVSDITIGYIESSTGSVYGGVVVYSYYPGSIIIVNPNFFFYHFCHFYISANYCGNVPDIAIGYIELYMGVWSSIAAIQTPSLLSIQIIIYVIFIFQRTIVETFQR